MKKAVLLSIGLAVAGGQARAQVFRPGWVLPMQGDTLRGEVEDDGWEGAPTRVRFRAAAGAEIATLTGAEVRAFRLARGRFFRYETLPLDRAAQTALQMLSTTMPRNPQPESFLAEVLVDGPTSLLHTSVNAVPHYFVRRPGQPVLELAARNYLRQGVGHAEIVDGNNYRAELTQYFGDCPAAVQAIGTFQASALVKVVQAYNQQCATPPQLGTEYRPATYRHIGGYAVGVVAGGRYTSNSLRAEQPGAMLDGYNLDGRVHPIGGVFADVSTPGRRFAVHFSATLTRIGHREQFATANPNLTAQLDNQATVLELRLGARYFWANTRREEHFFVGSGLTIPGALGLYESTLIHYSTNQQQQRGDYLPSAYPSGLLPYLEVGVQKGRFTLAVDGRMQRAADTYPLSRYLPTTGAIYYFSTDDYTSRVWYVGATLGVALLWKP